MCGIHWALDWSISLGLRLLRKTQEMFQTKRTLTRKDDHLSAASVTHRLAFKSSVNVRLIPQIDGLLLKGSWLTFHS